MREMTRILAFVPGAAGNLCAHPDEMFTPVLHKSTQRANLELDPQWGEVHEDEKQHITGV
jgi:hypothetical protein